MELTVGDFKSRFSEALEIVAQGGTVRVTYGRARKPVAILAPPPAAAGRRKLGLFAGKMLRKRSAFRRTNPLSSATVKVRLMMVWWVGKF